MAYKAGYWVDLNKVTLSDSGPTWIQGMPLGKYQHPFHGEIDLSEERVSRFAANVNNKVRTQDLDIDYDHKEHSGKAAGWVQAAEDRGADGLWLAVEFTPEALKAIKNKEYRYFSPEFTDEWEHPKTKQKFQDVLFGGAITNRPFLKDICPINMSELFEQAGDNKMNEGGKSMDPAKKAEYIKRFGLPEDASDEQVYAALDGALEDPDDDDGDGEGSDDGAEDQLPVAASEELKKLSESNPAIKSLLEMVGAQSTQLADMSAKLKEQETTATIAQLSEKAAKKGYAIPPSVTEAVTKVLTEAPKPLSEDIVKAFDKLLEVGLVQLGEKGRTIGTTETGDKSAAVKMGERVAEIIKADDKLSYADAVVRVAGEDPELFAEYQAESYAGRE